MPYHTLRKCSIVILSKYSRNVQPSRRRMFQFPFLSAELSKRHVYGQCRWWRRPAERSRLRSFHLISLALLGSLRALMGSPHHLLDSPAHLSWSCFLSYEIPFKRQLAQVAKYGPTNKFTKAFETELSCIIAGKLCHLRCLFRSCRGCCRRLAPRQCCSCCLRCPELLPEIPDTIFSGTSADVGRERSGSFGSTKGFLSDYYLEGREESHAGEYAGQKEIHVLSSYPSQCYTATMPAWTMN